MLEILSELLARIGAPGAFATRRTVAPGDLNLEVEGVGHVRLPVTPSAARKLCEAARPARHGNKDKTLLDKRVRNTWEIRKNRISIDQARWKKSTPPRRRWRGNWASCQGPCLVGPDGWDGSGFRGAGFPANRVGLSTRAIRARMSSARSPISSE